MYSFRFSRALIFLYLFIYRFCFTSFTFISFGNNVKRNETNDGPLQIGNVNWLRRHPLPRVLNRTHLFACNQRHSCDMSFKEKPPNRNRTSTENANCVCTARSICFGSQSLGAHATGPSVMSPILFFSWFSIFNKSIFESHTRIHAQSDLFT